MDAFIERLKGIVSEQAELEPAYNCLDQVMEFLNNIKDKYMFEFINLNNEFG